MRCHQRQLRRIFRKGRYQGPCVATIEPRISAALKSDIQVKQSWRHTRRPKPEDCAAVLGTHARHLAIGTERQHQRQ